MKLLNSIKKRRKEKLFYKNATCGKGLIITAKSFCKSPTPQQIVIGDNCALEDCRLYAVGNGRIEIGDHTTIRYNSKLSSVEHIKIGSHVIISNNIDIYDHNSHPTSPEIRWEMCENGFRGEAWSVERADHRPTVIEDNVWVGEKSVILKGVTIGKGSIVASHSVVTKDVPEYAVVAGNPAKVVKYLEHGKAERGAE